MVLSMGVCFSQTVSPGAAAMATPPPAAIREALPSPASFLGYVPGAHFTPHYRIVRYFEEVARAVPLKVNLIQYGKTYEGRPLLLAFIGEPGNLGRLEEIRLNNLRLAGVLKDGKAADLHGPVIVWLSYNVHGNEPSSSEAAMKTLYELVNPANSQAQEWLKHAIVVIDPCINPDGRDRYVNWYSTIAGLNPDPDPQSREHHEPWPGGRTNHYNFDLNRDWAWQTQTESRARLKMYNDWLPQVHVDFHEQGYNTPYYFAPAAEPYHDVITPWQREFQVMIGKNNAKYFDQHGWLYFTKEEFDLFYPSYGDTYPTFNGAIGMTFEQGGLGRGLAIRTSDGDTLTLGDRVEHHFTTGMSTIEMAATNAEKLLREFQRYFTEAAAHPSGEFKSYLIKADKNGDRLERLEALLTRNQIEWLDANPGSLTGVDYESGKTAVIKAAPGDIVVNSNQPRSNLIRVLFERVSRISDSVTYDITAWSVPFAYGLQAYGLASYAAGSPPNSSVNSNSGAAIKDDQYAYAVRWTGLASVRFLTELLQKGVKVRFAEQSFQSAGVEFDRGTLLLTATGNGSLGKSLWSIVSGAAGRAGVELFPIGSGFVEKGADFGSGHVHMIHKPRIALVTGTEASSEGAGEVWHLFEQEIGYPVTLVNAQDLGRLNWKNYDVVIIPDGNYRALSDKSILDEMRAWVKSGGRLIAMENAVNQLAKQEGGIHQKDGQADGKDEKDKKEADYSLLHHYGNRQRDEVVNTVPGSIYKVEMDNSHPLAFGYPDHYYTLKQDDHVYEFIKDGGWNVGVIRKDNYISGFTGVKAKEKLKDGLIFGVEDSGRGEIVYLADDPLFRSFWENGKLLFCNAVFLVGQ
jgi:hypothetical protein